MTPVFIIGLATLAAVYAAERAVAAIKRRLRCRG
jgi:hypothetical protein